jgi:hypothetical protein
MDQLRRYESHSARRPLAGVLAGTARDTGRRERR